MKTIGALIALVLLLAFTPAADAKKGGGGGGKPDTGMADADVTILYRELIESSADPAPIWKGDNAGNVELVTSTPGTWPSFGPAGTTKMVYASNVQGPGIYVAPDFSGAGASKLVATETISWTTPSWSNGDAPNGEEMIVYIDEDAESGIQQLFATTLSGEVTQLTFDDGGPMTFSTLGYPITTDGEDPVSFGWQVKYHPSWNPVTNDEVVLRGQYVVVEPEESYYVRSLWLLKLEGDPSTGELWVAETENLTFGTALHRTDPLSPSFSPDGKGIVFQAWTSGVLHATEIWSYDRVEAAFTNLTNGAASHANHPCVRTDGRILFSRLQPHRSMTLAVMEGDGSNLDVYGNAKGKNAHRQFHPASRR